VDTNWVIYKSKEQFSIFDHKTEIEEEGKQSSDTGEKFLVSSVVADVDEVDWKYQDQIIISNNKTENQELKENENERKEVEETEVTD